LIGKSSLFNRFWIVRSSRTTIITEVLLRYSVKALNSLKYAKRILSVMLVMASLTAFAGCALPEARIHTEPPDEKEISGTFTLILYGGNYLNDLETVAFLDREGDAFTFDIYAPDFDYRTIKGLSATEGLKRAEDFVSRNTSFQRVRLSSIVEAKAGIIGYEVRPLYLPFTYGTDDLLDISYGEEGNKVVVTIRLKPSIENLKSRRDIDTR
jgi:hypothetical protein